MNTRVIISLLCLIFLMPLISEAKNDDISLLKQENELLESELKLAKKKQLYFIFDLKKGSVLLKTRGTVFKEMKIKEKKFWGDPVETVPVSLLKKSAFKEPKRETIQPEKIRNPEENNAPVENKKPAEPGKFEIQALELDDMPENFNLTLDKNIVISVRSTKEGFMSGINGAVNYLGWYITRPLITVWNVMEKRPYSSIQLVMDAKDAQALYWSFSEGMEAVIYTPGNF